MLLAGDVGGTKTNLAIYDGETGLYTPVAEAMLPSANYASLEDLVHEFLSEARTRLLSARDAGRWSATPSSLELTRASFGVAGPVVSGQVTVTNLPWRVSQEQLGESLGLTSVHLLNDLEAVAYAVPRLRPADLHVLNTGKLMPEGTIAVIAPGTGLGEAFLTWEGNQYCAHPSEGGHADFAPTDTLELGLLSHLWDRYEHVSYERVCSGLGIPNIYGYLKSSGYAEEPTWLAERLTEVSDATPIIVNNALDDERRCALCEGTLRTFVSILGAEAGNLALKTLATGGVYLAGGIPPRILPALDEGVFMRAFCDKGRFEDMMVSVPVYVICNPKAPLLGAAAYGLEVSV